MPTWFLAALLAALLWAVVVFVDDNLLKNVYKTAAFGAMISGLFGFFPSLYLFVTNPDILYNPHVIVPAVLAGILTIVYYYFYFSALDVDEPSVAVAIMNLAPGILPFLAFIFLGETLFTHQYIGLGIILLSSTLLTLLDAKKLRFSSAIKFGIIGALTYAVVALLCKYAYGFASFKDVYMWVTFGFGVGGTIFLIFNESNKKTFKRIMKKSPLLIFFFLIIAEVFNAAAEWTHGFALSTGPVSLVTAIVGTSPLFLLLSSVVLRPFFPKRFRENKDDRFYRKIFCMLLMIFGLLLIQ